MKHSHLSRSALSNLHLELLKWNVFRSNILPRFEQKFEITSEKQFKGPNSLFEIITEFEIKNVL